ncbi:hypothetical protein A4X09_0g1160 [Tilletia walkeri]|uniref:PROP1-like PPR domain-containing protein n=1 Tax=Tilletia walkeri TaxID=117179 RepID=A0A8X7T7R5_9BASI|nr:hypothetical protein A4X09_0g1160 [Tilletia walkeri]
MPAPSLGKIAPHLSRVAANSAAAGIRSALHTGNGAATSAAINVGATATIPPRQSTTGRKNITALIRDAVQIGEPMSAVKLLSKLEELNTGSSAASQTRASDTALVSLVGALVHLLPPKGLWHEKKAEVDATIDAIARTLKGIGPGEEYLDKPSKALLFRAGQIVRQHAKWELLQVARRETLQKQPWKDATPLVTPPPSLASEEPQLATPPSPASKQPEPELATPPTLASDEPELAPSPIRASEESEPTTPPTLASEEPELAPSSTIASEQPELATDVAQAESSDLTPPASPEHQVQATEAPVEPSAPSAPVYEAPYSEPPPQVYYNQGPPPGPQFYYDAGPPPVPQFYYNPGPPPVQLVDVDLGNEIETLVRPQRLKGAQIVVDLQPALNKIYENVSIGTYPAPESIGVVMMALGRQGDLARVNEMYAIASAAIGALNGDPLWQADAWHKLEDHSLCALAHAGEVNGAIECRHRIIAAGRCPSADAYAALIATVKDTTDDALVAEELFDESQRLGVRPNVYLYTTVISKLSRARRISRALQLFDEMRKIGLRPSTVTYGAVINACVRSGDRDTALTLFSEMEADPKFKARVPPYNTMIQHFRDTKDRTQALFFYDKMTVQGVHPSSHTYKLLLDVHGTIEPVQPDEMEKVFEALSNERSIKVQGTHWASLIQCYGTHLKNVEKAIEIFHKSSQSSAPDPIAFEALLSVFFDANRPDLIRQYVDSMQGSGLRVTAYVCNVLIKGLALEGSAGLVEARHIFEQMQDPPAGLAATGNHAARSHGAGAVPQAEAANIPSPEAVSSSGYLGSFGTTTAGSFSQIFKEPSTYESMIRAELTHGNVDMANGLLDRMEARGFPPALILRTRSLLEIPREQALTADLLAAPLSTTPSATDADLGSGLSAHLAGVTLNAESYSGTGVASATA